MSSPAGSFLTGFADSFLAQKQRKAADVQREEDRAMQLEDRQLYRRQVEEDRAWRAEGGAGGGGSGGSGGESDAWGSSAEPFRASDPVNANLAPHQRAFLNAISAGESGGKYNIRYTPSGGATFDLAGGHPRIFEPGPHGKSSAAGRYQFTWTTWKDIAGADTPFTPENQDTYAWQLASRDYKSKTGRDLDEVLRSEGLTNEIMATLTPTWQAFKGNRGRWASTYQDSLSRLSGAPAERPVERKSVADPAISARPASSPVLSFGLPDAQVDAAPQRRRIILPLSGAI